MLLAKTPKELEEMGDGLFPRREALVEGLACL